VVLNLAEEPDYSYIAPDPLEISLPSGHELKLDHIFSNSYSVLVGMQSNKVNAWKNAYSTDALFSKVLRASVTDNNEVGNYPQYQICDKLQRFKSTFQVICTRFIMSLSNEQGTQYFN
jgi:hypothetical protein